MFKKLTLLSAVFAVIFMVSCDAGGQPASEPAPEPAEIVQDMPAPTPGETDAAPSPETLSAVSTAYERYTEVMKITNSVFDTDDIQVDMDFFMDTTIDIDMPGEDMSMFTSMNGNMKIITGGDSIKYSSVMYMSDSFTNGYYVIEMCYDGQYGYYAINDYEIEMPIDELEMQIISTADIPEFPESAIKSVDTQKGGNSEVTTIIVDGAELTGYIFESAGTELSALGAGADLSVEDVKIVIINQTDGTPVSVETEMKMTMMIDDMEHSLFMTIKTVLLKYGGGVEVDLSKLEGKLLSN